MTATRNRTLRAAAIGFAGATTYNSVVAIREKVPGEPFGIRIPLSVSTGILVGWGSAVAAPWPMPVSAVLAANPIERRRSVSRCTCLVAAPLRLGVEQTHAVFVKPLIEVRIREAASEPR